MIRLQPQGVGALTAAVYIDEAGSSLYLQAAPAASCKQQGS